MSLSLRPTFEASRSDRSVGLLRLLRPTPSARRSWTVLQKRTYTDTPVTPPLTGQKELRTAQLVDNWRILGPSRTCRAARFCGCPKLRVCPTEEDLSNETGLLTPS